MLKHTKQFEYRKKEILEELYSQKRMSTYEIAKIFGVDDFTILRWLRRHEIPRRSRGRLVENPKYRKKGVLEKLYLQKRMSTHKIAEIFDVDDFTILRWLRKYGIPRRSRTEYGVIKYPKKAFSGDLIEKSYLIGLRYGDLHARREGRQIRVSTTSSHPALLALFREIFSNYTTRMNIYPNKDRRGYFGWCVSCLLHPSFDFLLNKGSAIPSWILQNERYFFSFLAGFFDSEGSIIICRARSNYVGYRIRIPNVNVVVLEEVKKSLLKLKFCPKLYLAYRSGRCWKVEIYRKSDVFRFLSLIPIKHSEKIMKRELAFQLKGTVKFWEEAWPKVLALRSRIRGKVRRCMRKAEIEYWARLRKKGWNHDSEIPGKLSKDARSYVLF
jgi:transposase